MTMRLAVRTPFAGPRAAGLPRLPRRAGRRGRPAPGWYARTLDLPHGPGTVRLELADAAERRADRVRRRRRSRCTTCATPRPPSSAPAGCVDADCDPVAVDDALRRRPGDRPAGPRAPRACGCPGQVDGDEIAVRTVIGQQVSVAGARTVTGRLVAEHGRAGRDRRAGLTHLFPDAATLAALDPEALPMPRSRGRALVALARRSPPATSRSTAAPTATTYAARCSRCPASARGRPTTSRCARSATPTSSCRPTSASATRSPGSAHDPAAVIAGSDAWRPWRSYALLHLWNTLMPPVDGPPASPTTTDDRGGLTCGP